MTEIKSSACFTSGKSQCLTAPCRWNISLKLGITSFFLTLVCLQLVWMNCEIPIKVTESNTLWLTLWLIFGDSPLILCVSLFIHTLISKLSMYHIPARWVTTELEGLRNPDLYHFVPRPWRQQFSQTTGQTRTGYWTTEQTISVDWYSMFQSKQMKINQVWYDIGLRH